MKALLFMALDGLGLSFTGLFVLFGLHEVIAPGPGHPDHNRSEGAPVHRMRSVAVSWRRAGAFDRLVAGAAPTAELVKEGVKRGFIDDASNAGVQLIGDAPPVSTPGNGALLATLAGRVWGC